VQHAGGVIDTMIGFPTDPEQLYVCIRTALHERESLEDVPMPAGHMSRDVVIPLSRSGRLVRCQWPRPWWRLNR
jgi:hypothetical protein